MQIADKFECLLDLLMWVRDESQERARNGSYGLHTSEIMEQSVENFSMPPIIAGRVVKDLQKSGFLQKISVGVCAFYLVPELKPESEPAGTHQCPYCDKTTPTKTGLTHHVVRMHKGESLLSRDLQHAAKSGKGVSALGGIR